MYTRKSISYSWSLPAGAGSTGSQVSWRLTGRGRRAACNAEGGTSCLITGDSYTITDLSSGTSYDITLTIFHPAGNIFTTFTTSTDGSVSNTFGFKAISLSNRQYIIIIIIIINCISGFWCTDSGGCGSCSHNHSASHCHSHSSETIWQKRRYNGLLNIATITFFKFVGLDLTEKEKYKCCPTCNIWIWF